MKKKNEKFAVQISSGPSNVLIYIAQEIIIKYLSINWDWMAWFRFVESQISTKITILLSSRVIIIVE